MAKPSKLAEIAGNPFVFALGIGIANGVLAAARDKPISQLALYSTVAVLTVGELILLWELPPEEKPDLAHYGLVTAAGAFAGMAPFVSWNPGEKPWMQQLAEKLVGNRGADPEAA